MESRYALSAVLTLALLAGTAGAQVGFGTAVMYPSPSSPDGLASGDFTSQGRLDLAVATSTPSRITILPNNFNGTFAAPMYIPLPADSEPDFVRAADMDGDGDTDLVVALKHTGQVAILLNDGGVFTNGPVFTVGANPRWLMVGPLHGGTSNDIVVANRGDGTVTVLLHGTGLNFTASTYPVGADPRSITRLDMNGDGFPEVLVTSYADRNFTTLLNDGTGHFTQGGTTSVGATFHPNGIFAADLNHDSKLDVVVAVGDSTGQGFVSVFMNNNGVLAAPVNYPTLGINPGQVLVADLDRDGNPDLAVVNTDSGNIATLRNAGNGTFSTAELFPVGAGPRVMTIVDLDHDFIPDIAVTNLTGNSTSVLINSLASPPCYANCDGSTATPILTANDFQCFLTGYTLGQSFANCDHSTVAPVLNIADFACFMNAFAAGCS